MQRIPVVLAYSAAAAMLLLAIAAPFVLAGFFTQAVAGAGLHVDAAYSGGAVVRTAMRRSERGLWQIAVYERVRPHVLQPIEPFVQVAFRPVEALPRVVDEEVDLDGDGQADVRIRFTVPDQPHRRPVGSVEALNPTYASFTSAADPSFSRFLLEADGAILVRVPLR